MRFAVIVPTLNPGANWSKFIAALAMQTQKPDEVLIIDSGSQDESLAQSVEAGFHVVSIEQSEFDHGGTRNRAVSLCADIDIAVFLTQDAILSDCESLHNILQAFAHDKVAAVCGRQLPREQATAIEAHARLYNYTATSTIRSFQDRRELGLKVAFLSNSYAAYRMSSLQEVGGFPEKVIYGEDMYVAALLLKAGYDVAYAAEACVYHSHDYSLLQEMRRYFDLGVFHAHEPWIREQFGKLEGEGMRFALSEQKYLLNHAALRIPEALIRVILRYSGFSLGAIESRLPPWLSKKFAMNKAFFNK